MAHDSPSDEPAITDVLAANVRDHVVDSRDPSCATLATVGGQVPPPLILPNDVRAAIQVLGGLNLEAQRPSDQNLTNVCLPRTDILALATLSGVDLSGANLTQATVGLAKLDRARMHQINLQGAQVQKANLAGADLTGANLSNADLTGADLTGANLSGANLAGANLTGTVGVNLAGTAGAPAAR